MKNKAFTLIELLAVIVILAIIALIAVPIILNIIDDSKNSSNKRSIELYAKAIENAVGNYQLKNPQDKDITLEKIEEYIEYKGNKVECETTEINEDGTIYLDKCKVNNKDVEYTYGKKENKSTIVYRASNSTIPIDIGDTINPDDYTIPTPIYLSFYLKYVVDKDNKVTESYVCGIFNSKETCLRGGSLEYYGYSANESEYTGNMLILKGLQNEGFSCKFDEDFSYCDGGLFNLNADSDGNVFAGDGEDYFYIDCSGSSYWYSM